jgi:hypothetical protein
MLRVTNRNNFTLKDRYDGIDYIFKPNESVVIEEDAARHFFGYGAPDKIPFLIRQGWAVSSDKIEEGLKILNKFVFEMGKVEFVGDSEETEEKKEEVIDDELPELKNKITLRDKPQRQAPVR